MRRVYESEVEHRDSTGRGGVQWKTAGSGILHEGLSGEELYADQRVERAPETRCSSVSISADIDTVVLVLTGEPIDEPIVEYGPFVMNGQEAVRQALTDLRSGRFRRVDAPDTARQSQ